MGPNAARFSGLATSMIDQALGLERLHWSDPNVILGWRWEVPAWGWVLIGTGAVGLALWCYRHLPGSRVFRIGLASIRWVVLVFTVVLLVGPLLVLPRERVEPDWLLLLVDRSASMTIQDERQVTQQVTNPKRISRDAAVRQAITRHAQMFSSQGLGRDRRLVWLGFDSHAYEIESPQANTGGWDVADGRSTALLTAIEQALQRARSQPISGLVLFTDGRSPQGTGADLIRRLQQLAVSVFGVPVGAADAPPDLSLARVDAPQRAFVNDTVPVTVWIDRYPAEAKVDPRRVRVTLVEAQTGRTVDESTADSDDLSKPIRLLGRSDAIGPVAWTVNLSLDPPIEEVGDHSGYEPELITDNNQRQISVEMVDRPIRVLYVEGYPRWDYRYLKTMLIREESIDCSIMLVSADREFAQEGDTPIARLPRELRELEDYDVVIIGDVSSGYFSPGQLQLLRDHVADSGAGLLWIAGQDHTPHSYESTALADLLPMRRPGEAGRVDPRAASLIVKPTPLAEALNVMKLTSTHQEMLTIKDTPHDTAWPSGLASLTWVQDVGDLKPSAEVLAEVGNDVIAAVPLVTRLRYGGGQSVYVATDEIWRWRYGRGDLYLQRFWLQLLRMLGRHRIAQETQAISLDISHRRVELGQAVIVELKEDETSLIDRKLSSVAVSVVAMDEPDPPNTERPPVVSQIELLRQTQRRGSPTPWDGARLREEYPDSREYDSTGYRAVWRPNTTGRLELRVVEPELTDLGLTARIEVIHPDDELRHPMPDHDRLEVLAQKTAGKIVPLEQLNELPSLIPNRARRTPDDISEPLWNSPLSLITVLLLLTAEWVGRRIIRLT